MSLRSRSTLSVLILVAVFAAGVGVGRYVRSSEGLKLAEAPTAVRAAASGDPAASAAAPSADLAKVLGEASVTERSLKFAELLRGLTAQNWRSVWDAFERERRATGKTHPDELALLASRIGELGGKEGAEFFAASKEYDLLRRVLTSWAGKDPTAALNWIARDADEETRRTVKGAVIRGLAATEPDLAITALEGIPLETRQNYVINFAATLVQSVGLAQTEALLDTMLKRALASGRGDAAYLRHIFADFAMLKVEHAFRYGEQAAVMSWLAQHAQQPYVDRAAIPEAAAAFARRDPMTALAWLQEVNRAATASDPSRINGYQGLVYGWVERDGLPAVGQWLLSNPQQQNYDRLALNYANMLAAKDPAGALAWAQKITHPAVKTQTLEQLQRLAAAKKR